jgi:hypothetical protein
MRAEACERIAVEMQVVAASKPYHQHIFCFRVQPETQGAAAQRNFFDVLDESLIVAVAFPATLAAALQAVTGIEDKIEALAHAGDPLDAHGGDKAVQIFQGAQVLVGASQQR